MNKVETYIRKELFKATTYVCGTCWARDIMDKLVNDVFVQMEKDTDVDNAIFKVLDTYY